MDTLREVQNNFESGKPGGRISPPLCSLLLLLPASLRLLLPAPAGATPVAKTSTKTDNTKTDVKTHSTTSTTSIKTNICRGFRGGAPTRAATHKGREPRQATAKREPPVGRHRTAPAPQEEEDEEHPDKVHEANRLLVHRGAPQSRVRNDDRDPLAGIPAIPSPETAGPTIPEGFPSRSRELLPFRSNRRSS